MSPMITARMAVISSFRENYTQHKNIGHKCAWGYQVCTVTQFSVCVYTFLSAHEKILEWLHANPVKWTPCSFNKPVINGSQWGLKSQRIIQWYIICSDAKHSRSIYGKQWNTRHLTGLQGYVKCYVTLQNLYHTWYCVCTLSLSV